MLRPVLSRHRLVASLALSVSVFSPWAMAAVGDGEGVDAASAAIALTELPDSTADVELRFLQEDGPDSGHVRVLLTPQSRPLTILEARSAAQQAFLQALDEPGLGYRLSRIVVVVRLAPGDQPQVGSVDQVFSFRNKGGRDWSITVGE